MMDNRTESTNSAFKTPLIPRPQPSQPRSQPESLLFNDILQEKTLALHNTLKEFLQVEPYFKFNNEFNTFLTQTKRIIQEGRELGTNASRLTNLSQISQTNRPSSSFLKPQTTISTINSNGTTSAFKIPETNCLNKKNLCSKITFLQPRVVLSRCDETTSNSNNTPSLYNSIIEENQNNSKSTCANNNTNQLATTSTTSNSYKKPALCKLIVEKNQSKSTSRNYFDHQLLINQSKVLGTVEKLLSMWTVKLKLNQSNETVFINITGNLLRDDRNTLAEKTHNAGILECTKENNLIITTNGLYRLVGKIIGGSPNELYRACMEINGIPKTWKSIIKNISGVNKNGLLNVPLKSAARSIKQTGTVVNLNESITRSGKQYNTKLTTIEGAKNHFDHNVTENNKKRRKLHEKTRPLLASTPKRPKLFDTPSQLLKNKFHQKVLNRTNEMSNLRTHMNFLNDSITVAKKRQSLKNNKIN